MAERYDPEAHYEFFDFDGKWIIEVPDIPREQLVVEKYGLLAKGTEKYYPGIISGYRNIVRTVDFLSEKHFPSSRRKVVGNFCLGLIRRKWTDAGLTAVELEPHRLAGMRKRRWADSKIEHFISMGTWDDSDAGGVISLGSQYRENYTSELQNIYASWSPWDPPGGRRFNLQGTERNDGIYDMLIIQR